MGFLVPHQFNRNGRTVLQGDALVTFNMAVTETLKLSFRKQLKQVEDQGLSNFARTKTIEDRVCLLGAPNSGQNLTFTSSVTSSHRLDLCRNFEINVGSSMQTSIAVEVKF